MNGHDPGQDDYASHGDHPDHDGHLGDPHPEHFHPGEALPHADTLHGDPYEMDHHYEHDLHDAGGAQHGGPEHWYDQQHHDHDQHHEPGSGIASQQLVLADLTGMQYTGTELLEIAIENGWYIEGGGTPLYDIGNLLEHFGVPVETRHDTRLEDLELALAEGMDVIVAVSAWEAPYTDLVLDLTAYSGIPGQDPGRAVQVTGVDRSDPAHPAVLVNDPGPAGGTGQAVPLADFLDAWAGSDNFTVLAGGQADA
jgi:hypothetical protein